MQTNVLFDLDGTISDPIVGISRSLNYALARFGHPPVDEPAVRPHIGPPLDEMFRAITGITDPARIAAHVATYRERYAEVGYAESKLYPGMAEALHLLAAAGIPLDACSSKRGDFAERILEM